jgi:hypothetical protein
LPSDCCSAWSESPSNSNFRDPDRSSQERSGPRRPRPKSPFLTSPSSKIEPIAFVLEQKYLPANERRTVRLGHRAKQFFSQPQHLRNRLPITNLGETRPARHRNESPKRLPPPLPRRRHRVQTPRGPSQNLSR